jgi:hypothetical protein
MTKRIRLGDALLAGQTAGLASNCDRVHHTSYRPVRYRENERAAVDIEGPVI